VFIVLVYLHLISIALGLANFSSREQRCLVPPSRSHPNGPLAWPDTATIDHRYRLIIWSPPSTL
jgi:hypothetical protein